MSDIVKISQSDLIKQHTGSTALFHLAKSPLIEKSALINTSGNNNQHYVWGFNLGGRPDGLWVAPGSAWVDRTTTLNNPSQFPTCCYLYEVKLRADANVMRIITDEDLKALNDEGSNYWVNFDYIHVEFTDYETGKELVSKQRFNLNWQSLKKKKDQPLKDVLVKNKVIFLSEKDAAKGSAFYKRYPTYVGKFKYKDWNELSRKYDGVIFENYDLDNRAKMYHVWFQSLDAPSGCIWNPEAIESITLKYVKINQDTWEVM